MCQRKIKSILSSPSHRGSTSRLDGDAGESDYQALVAKCQSLYDMGVRSFAIFFDDISNKDGVNQQNCSTDLIRNLSRKKGRYQAVDHCAYRI